MIIDKITLQWPFNVGSFLNAKVGLEAALEEGDDIEDCYRELSKRAKALAAFEQGGALILNNNHEAFRGVAEQAPYVPLYAKNFVPPPPPKPHEPVTEEKLRECKTIADLEWWFDAIDAKNGEERTALWNVYDEMFEKLNHTVITE
jgi:hypothetical protein